MVLNYSRSICGVQISLANEPYPFVRKVNNAIKKSVNYLKHNSKKAGRNPIYGTVTYKAFRKSHS